MNQPVRNLWRKLLSEPRQEPTESEKQRVSMEVGFANYDESQLKKYHGEYWGGVAILQYRSFVAEQKHERRAFDIEQADQNREYVRNQIGRKCHFYNCLEAALIELATPDEFRNGLRDDVDAIKRDYGNHGHEMEAKVAFLFIDENHKVVLADVMEIEGEAAQPYQRTCCRATEQALIDKKEEQECEYYKELLDQLAFMNENERHWDLIQAPVSFNEIDFFYAYENWDN